MVGRDLAGRPLAQPMRERVALRLIQVAEPRHQRGRQGMPADREQGVVDRGAGDRGVPEPLRAASRAWM
jgi:hypothetical protein